jgi:biofilm PGA synthesis N-glycosyltransferase PgaC
MKEIQNHLVLVLVVIFILTCAIQVLYYLVFYTRFVFHSSKSERNGTQPVSVIICARNEVNNLRKNIEAILDQAYDHFEVIVVNDCSWDESGIFLEELQKKYSRLKVVTIQEQEKYRHAKKFALTLGIKAAANEILLLTDADCIPAGKNWISGMQSHFDSNTEIVLGYGSYKKEKGFLNKVIRFDTMMIALQYFSFSLAGNTYMGTGRNLAYRKSLFFRTKGFARHYHLLSGDDDLFVNENATTGNTKIEFQQDSFTISDPKKTWANWFVQKRRHVATGRYYKPNHKMLLFTNSFSGLLFYFSLIALLILRFDWRIILSLYMLKILVEFPVLYSSSKKLRSTDLVWIFPVLEFVMTLLQPIFFFSNLVTKQKTWK